MGSRKWFYAANYCRLTSFSQSLQTNLRITLDDPLRKKQLKECGTINKEKPFFLKVPQNNASTSTIILRLQDIEKRINPILGDKPVYLITQMDIQKMYARLKKHGRKHEHPEYGYNKESND